LSIKRDNELEHAKIFVTWLNGNKGFDYEAISNENENREHRDVDVFAISPKGLPKLKLQLVSPSTVEHALNQAPVEEIDGAKVKRHAGSGNSEAIGQAILKKSQKYGDSSDLILVLQTTYPTPPNLASIIEKLRSDENPQFKGIYYIERSREVLESGWVPVPEKVSIIKDAWADGKN